MDPAHLLKEAREAAGLSQSEMAAIAGVRQSMISAYERGGRDPGSATLAKLLAAAGAELAVRVTPLGADVDARIERALALPPEKRAESVSYALITIARACTGVPFAIAGAAAALVQGAPVQPALVEVRLADDDATLAAAYKGLRGAGAFVWSEELERFTWITSVSAFRAQAPSRWWLPVCTTEVRFQLCAARELAAVATVPFGEASLPVVGPWDVAIDDEGVAEILDRTRRIVAAQRARSG